MTLGALVKAYRKANGLTMKEFGERIGRTKGYISQLESGINPTNGRPIRPTLETVQRIAAAMGEDTETLIRMLDGWTGEEAFTEAGLTPMPAVRRFPVLGTIACGQPILAEENIEETVYADADLHADFCLRCQGDSMINARIFDGDMVFLRAQNTVENGEIAAVLVDDLETKATLKRVRRFPDHLVLEAENPRYRPLVFWGPEMERVRIIGKAVYFMSSIF